MDPVAIMCRMTVTAFEMGKIAIHRTEYKKFVEMLLPTQGLQSITILRIF